MKFSWLKSPTCTCTWLLKIDHACMYRDLKHQLSFFLNSEYSWGILLDKCNNNTVFVAPLDSALPKNAAWGYSSGLRLNWSVILKMYIFWYGFKQGYRALLTITRTKTLSIHALDWLNKRGRILCAAIQPIECLLFALFSSCSRYRCSGTGP